MNLDLVPFWGITPTRLRVIQLAHEGHSHSYTLVKSSPAGPLHIGNETMPADEAARKNLLVAVNQLLELMKGVQADLPHFGAVFSPHDNPNVFITRDMKKKVVEAGQKGKGTSILPHQYQPLTLNSIRSPIPGPILLCPRLDARLPL
jgi:hypothetical protein